MTDFPFPAAGPPAISPLATTGEDAHPLAAGCPLACLAGLLSPQALNRILAGARQREAVTIGDLAGLYRARTLGEVPGIGAGRATEIEALLLAAGLISSAECYLAAAASELARQQRNWLAVIDGPVIGYLRDSGGFSQVLVARRSGLSVAAVARAESEPASYCHRSTLARLAKVLGVPASGLEHPAHQHWPAAGPCPAPRHR
jgi:hypothetical protein